MASKMSKKPASTTSRHELFLERAALGEVSAEELEGLDAASRARIRELAASSEQILQQHPPARVAAQLRARHEARRGPRRTGSRVLFAALPAAAAIGLAVALVPRAEGPHPGAEPAAEVRAKGAAPHLVVFKKSPSGQERLEAGAVVRAADLLQLEYVALGRRFGAIVSIDGRGGVTLHHGATSVALDPEGTVALPDAFELDDAPGFERFFFVTATAPFDVQVVVEAAKKLAADPALARRGHLPLPGSFEESSLELGKVAP